MELKTFQLQAVRALFDAMELSARDIVLKSPTGSGKTIILTHFMHQYILSHPGTVFIWLTPGKGGLEEQSKEKMDRYIPASQTKLLSDVMTDGFRENDCCFINWEKLTRKGNNALKEGERTNFLEHIGRAIADGLHFVVIVDESHQNNTVKANEILQYFHTKKIIRCSATPKAGAKAKRIEITEEEVIAAGLIKKMLVINEDFPQVIETGDQTEFLLERACAKQRLLRQTFLRMGKDINPLIVVQLPNRSEALRQGVEAFFARQGISTENGRLAIWLSDCHENLGGIDALNAPQEAVIIKQAVATGWDCPRAHILVKLRDNMEETFEIQTIGRIRRMPEAKHYGNDVLDSCYLYTLDERFTAGVKQSLGKGALDACTLFLKNEYKNLTLVSEQRTMVSASRDPQRALSAIAAWFAKVYGTGGDKSENRQLLEAAGYLFSENIIHHIISGETATIDNFDASGFETSCLSEKLSTHRHGRDYHQKVGRMGMEIDLEYAYMNAILRKLFDAASPYSRKILTLTSREVYAFVINNDERLRHAVRSALAEELAQIRFDAPAVSQVTFHIPRACLFTYDGAAKAQMVMRKNVYENYLSAAEPRSPLEHRFEKFCERAGNVEWVYKNGDKGSEYFSLVYQDHAGRQKTFFPDYLVGVKGEVWIIEAKDGFDRAGVSQNVDCDAQRKFDILKAYLDKHGMKGGLLRYDEKRDTLRICTETYSGALDSECWTELEEILG